MTLYDHIRQLYQAELYEDLIHLVWTLSLSPFPRTHVVFVIYK